jgi:glycosyltransferase involved in cell wall biosynthesis
MAAAIPVVGVNRGGIAEIIVDGETGLLAPPDDASGLAQRIESLIHDGRLCRRLGEAGRKRALVEFDVKRSAERMLEVYTEAMTRPVSSLGPNRR